MPHVAHGRQAYDEIFFAMDTHPNDEFVQGAAIAAMKYLTAGEITGNDGSVAGDDVSIPTPPQPAMRHSFDEI